MKRYFIGIDQGTTGSTALLIDENWDVVASKNVEHMQIYPKPGWVEHDPVEIWNAIQTAAASVLRRLGRNRNRLYPSALTIRVKPVWSGIRRQALRCTMHWSGRTDGQLNMRMS